MLADVGGQRFLERGEGVELIVILVKGIPLCLLFKVPHSADGKGGQVIHIDLIFANEAVEQLLMLLS